ncbi:MAG: hypothetical protein II208_01980, partial [Alphaproteobacteria bacterium]|nr:hypothetical protein [Alphaproteobacteria bacterium]
MKPAQYFDAVIPTVDMTIRSELYHTNEFNFAVAVILSAQATDKKVNEVTPELFRVAPTPQKMLNLGIDGLKEHIRVISFFNNKAKNIIALAERLVAENMTDTFPDKYHNRDELMKLPGIGQKTAVSLENAGIYTLYDLLCRFPRAYENHTPVFSLADATEGHPV